MSSQRVETTKKICGFVAPLIGLSFTTFVNFALLCSFRYNFVPAIVNRTAIGGIFFITLCLFSSVMAIAVKKFTLNTFSPTTSDTVGEVVEGKT